MSNLIFSEWEHAFVNLVVTIAAINLVVHQSVTWSLTSPATTTTQSSTGARSRNEPVKVVEVGQHPSCGEEVQDIKRGAEFKTRFLVVERTRHLGTFFTNSAIRDAGLLSRPLRLADRLQFVPVGQRLPVSDSCRFQRVGFVVAASVGHGELDGAAEKL